MDIMIQQLFGAIIENIIPLVVIGGVILNIYKRFKEGASGQNQSQQRRPDIQQSEGTERKTESNPFETMFEELDRKGREIFEQMDRREDPKPEVPNKYDEALSRINSQQEMSVPHRTDLKKVATVAPPKQKKSSSGALRGGISRKRAVEGVIWAEILGPPRSKRPHSTYSQLNSRK